MSVSKRKKERRQARKERNQSKDFNHKRDAWISGKLIEENHNLKPYSEEYTIELANRLLSKVTYSLSLPTVDDFINSFREYKNKIRDLIILWNPNVPEEKAFEILRTSLELYWDTDIDITIKLKSCYD